MSTKSKGINAERELIHLFWQNKPWAACRIAGSGSSTYPSADILASNSTRKIAIESKVTKEKNKYFSQQEIADFKHFCLKFGAEPWIAIKFHRTSWFFLKLEDLEQTNKGHSISLKNAQNKGISFENLIK